MDGAARVLSGADFGAGWYLDDYLARARTVRVGGLLEACASGYLSVRPFITFNVWLLFCAAAWNLAWCYLLAMWHPRGAARVARGSTPRVSSSSIAILGSLVGLGVGFLYVLPGTAFSEGWRDRDAGPQQQADAALIATFAAHRDSCEQLREMLRQDASVGPIGKDQIGDW